VEWSYPLRLVVALGLGILVGLERESAKLEHHKLVFGGVRTHPLISLFGFGCAWLADAGLTFALPAGLVGLGILAGISYWAKIGQGQFGMTSEISGLLTFVTGALALLADIWAALALGIINVFLLSEKSRLESFVERLDRTEFLAVLKFLIVTAIILPIVPDQEYTQFGLNPAKIWRIVVLVSSIGFVGYFLTRKFGARVGIWLSGLLGGIVSSTAVTIAMGRMAQRQEDRSRGVFQAALLAAAVMYLRLLVLIWVLGPETLTLLWWKFVALSLVGIGLALTLRPQAQESQVGEHPVLQNPFEITPALIFGAVFVLLLVATQVVQHAFGQTGTIVLAAVMGVSDVDPFVISMVQAPGGAASLAATAVIVAAMSNTIAKGVYLAALVPAIRRSVLLRYGCWALLHLPFVFF
jgi:uncharacterized membrane protein (DUF4010 family)